MGGGMSKEAFEGIDEDLLKDAASALEDQGDSRVDIVTQKLQEILELPCPDDDDAPFVVYTTNKDGSALKEKQFEKKRKAKKFFKKVDEKGKSAILVKNNTVVDKFVTGNPKTVAFMVGVAFGRGQCDLGCLSEDDSPYQVFKDDDDEDDESDDDDDDDGSDDEEDEFMIWTVTKDGTGIKSVVCDKKKEAKKKMKKKQKKGRPAILTKGGELIKYTEFEDDEPVKQMVFLIGVGFGRELCGLGPCDNDGPYCCFEEDEEDD